MNRILVLFLVMLVVATCGGSATPDVVATEVAQALAVAGTLTATAPTGTATSTPTSTLASTATWTPVSTPTASPSFTPTPTPSRTPTATETPTAIPTFTAAPTFTSTPKLAATPRPTAVPRACSPFPALIELVNEQSVDATVALNGPEQVTLSVPGGGKARYCLVPGEYAYTITAPDGRGSGTHFFSYTPQKCECRWLEVDAMATPPPCFGNLCAWMEAHGISWDAQGRPYYEPGASCTCPADRSLYRPALLKPGTKPWSLQQASAHCTNPNLCVILPAPGSKISGNVHIVGSANAENFLRYKVEWWGEGGSSWAFLLERTTPVVNGELLMLNTSTVPEGKYGLRLTVIDLSGNYGEPFEIWWTVTR